MKNKTRKSKKILMVAAIALMVALVAAMGTMTYSRYITSTDLGSQSATAAKWGFLVSANATNLFSDDYSGNVDDLAVVVTPTGVAVHADTEDKMLVAPGTTGSMTITVTGEAEVLAKFVLSFNCTADVSATPTEGSVYYPLQWQITDGTNTSAWTTGTDAFEDVVADFAGNNSYLAAGTEVNKTYTITWRWLLDGGNNAADTAIGLKAASKELPAGFSAATVGVTFGLSASITQEQVVTTP